MSANEPNLADPRTERVARAARAGLCEHLPLAARDVAFAGVLRDLGDGADLTLAAGAASDEPGVLATIAYALLLRACALADEAGDDALANACAESIELLEPELSAVATVRN